jgi:hypothetical protein
VDLTQGEVLDQAYDGREPPVVPISRYQRISDMPSDLASLLRQRGHEVTKEGTDKDLLLPITAGSDTIDLLKETLFQLMYRDNTRKALRAWAHENNISNTGSSLAVREYIEQCAYFNKSVWSGADERIRRYSHTYEWYVSELLRRNFAARASGFNIRLKDAHPKDEFDCIAILDQGSVFIECKTGADKVYKDVSIFMRRDAELAAKYSIYLVDRDYMFKSDGEDTPSLLRSTAMELGILGIFKVSVGSYHFFEIWNHPVLYGYRYFLASTSFRGLQNRIRYMIRYCDRGTLLRPPDLPLYKREEIFCYGPDPRGVT